MMRLAFFLIGFALFLYGAASNFEQIPLPFDPKSKTVSFLASAFTLDTVMMIVGVFMLIISWLIHRLRQ